MHFNYCRTFAGRSAQRVQSTAQSRGGQDIVKFTALDPAAIPFLEMARATSVRMVGLLRFNEGHPGRLVGTAQVPHIPDRFAPAPHASPLCQKGVTRTVRRLVFFAALVIARPASANDRRAPVDCAHTKMRQPNNIANNFSYGATNSRLRAGDQP
jgi:hypothetical protein